MRKIVLYIATSLDGYIAGEKGDIDWLFTDHDCDYGYGEFYSSVDSIIMGRKSYDKLLDFDEFPYKDKNCYIFTRTLPSSTEGTVSIINKQDPELFMKGLLESNGRDIWLLGGGEMVAYFLKNDLVDKIILSIHPVIIGGGVPLFERCNVASEWSLDDVESFGSGLVQITYDKIIKGG